MSPDPIVFLEEVPRSSCLLRSSCGATESFDGCVATDCKKEKKIFGLERSWDKEAFNATLEEVIPDPVNS